MLKRVPIRARLFSPSGLAIAFSEVAAELIGYGLDEGVLVMPTTVTGVTDAAGEAVLSLWPNARGGESTYRFTCANPNAMLRDVRIYVPDGDEEDEQALDDLIWVEPAPEPVED